ncbi:threonylcarbamoyl-AMP synthase [Planctomycetota bacterium]|nr:threonylcarbamoyl-AMP synthase [Planctomycetota bacterium]
MSEFQDQLPTNIRDGYELQSLQEAADIIRAGGVVAFATETVYGLGANAFDSQAVAQVFNLKARPAFDPLIVHVDSVEAAKEIAADFNEAAIKLAAAFWPGPLTLVVKKKDIIPDIVTSGLQTVGLRLPKHPVARSLIEQTGTAIAAPSANKFASISPTTAEHVWAEFGDELSMILDGGPSETGLESTVISVVGDIPTVLRLGGTSLEALESILGKGNVKLVDPKDATLKESAEKGAASPGMLERHYAPKTNLHLIDSISDIDPLSLGQRVGLISFTNNLKNAQLPSNIVIHEVLSDTGDLNEAAANLFGSMRRLDHEKLDAIIAIRVPSQNLGRAINDRLQRASLK